MKLAHRLVTTAVLALGVSSSWAADLQHPGLRHFVKVNDHIYRGAQPADAGWETLAGMGVKVVVDLRRDGENGEHSTRAEARAVEAAGMTYVNAAMKGVVAPSDSQISRLMSLLRSGTPVFVHCREGKDRTGTVIACYRIAFEGWTNGKALDEAKSLGMHFVEIGMKRYIAGYRPGAAPVLANVQSDVTTGTASSNVPPAPSTRRPLPIERSR